MKVRIITAVTTLPLLILPIYFSGLIMYILVFLLSIIGLYEFFRAYKIQQTGLFVITGITTLLHYILLWQVGMANFALLITFYILTLLIYFVIVYPRVEFKSLGLAMTGFFYIAFLLSYIALVRENEQYGLWFVWLIFFIAFGSDTFAYIFGRLFGKHKLAKTLSPKKTVEGSIGGVFGAILLTLGYGLFMYYMGAMEDLSNLAMLAVIGGVGAILSQIGDLVASAIKRQTEIKDFGNFLPGHGGILDRFDSNILTAPFVYYIMTFFIVNN